MTRTVDAIYSQGVFRPVEPLALREHARVRITVETSEAEDETRAAALARLRAGFSKMTLRTNGTPPSREQLHDRD